MIQADQAAGHQTRRRLGRGLESLLAAPVRIDVPAADPGDKHVARPPEATHQSNAANEMKPAVDGFDSQTHGVAMRFMPVELLQPNPSQPRQDFDEASLAQLAASIRDSGVMQPILVRPAEQGRFQIIAGERRWRAARLANLPHIPALVRDADDQAAAELSLIENLQREDLNPIERAEAFARLVDQFALTHQQIADRVRLDRSSISNHLRLNELDDQAKTAVRGGLLTLGHAKALLGIANIQRRSALAQRCMRERWSVRELERRARDAAGEKDPASRASSAPASHHMADMERRLATHLGTKVRLRPGRTKGAGTLTIEFYTFDQFEGLMKRLQFKTH